MPDYYESPSPTSPPEPARLGLRPLATTLWCLGGLLVAVAVVAAGWAGVKVAEKRLPGSDNTVSFARDAQVTVRGSREAPLVLALGQRDLREYFFRESSIPGTGLEGIGDGRVFEHRGTLEVRVAGTDGDLVQVEIVEGPRVGETFWMETPEFEARDASVDSDP